MRTSYTMVLFTICALYAIVVAGKPMVVPQQHLLGPGRSPRHIPGGSFAKLCPESRDSDLLRIDYMSNVPFHPYLDDVVDLMIWGNFTRDIPINSSLNYQINITANTGDFGALNGSFTICDALDQLHQPPESQEPKINCPPEEGPVFIDYAWWFWKQLVAPGLWSVKFDALTPEGHRIYCLQSVYDVQCSPDVDWPECLRDSHENAARLSK